MLEESTVFCLFCVAERIVHHILGIREKKTLIGLTAISFSPLTAAACKVTGTKPAQEEMKSSSSLIFPACLLQIILEHSLLLVL